MNLLYFLNERLEFIRRLYVSTVVVFEERKKKNNAGDPPYVDDRDLEDAYEPAFLEEWQEADDSITVIGHWCLCMVHASLYTYLKDCIGPLGSVWWDVRALEQCLASKKAKGRSLFERYRLLFLDLDVDWTRGPVPLSELEQLNLTRDDLVHNVEMGTMDVKRVKNHSDRFPNGLFVDDLWANIGLERLKLDREKLELAIRLVTEFCTWLDDIRCNYPSRSAGN